MERTGKAKGTCVVIQEKEGETVCQMWISSSCWGIASGQYLCSGGLSYLRADQEKFDTRLLKLSICSANLVLYEERFGEHFSSNALNQKCF